MKNMDGKEYEMLEAFAEKEPDLSTVKAQSWLNFYYDADYFNEPEIPNMANGYEHAPNIPAKNQQISIDHELSAIPNPASHELDIFFTLPKQTEKATVAIHDINGRLIREFPVSSPNRSVHWNISNVENGIYVYSLLIDGKKYASKKLAVIK